MTDTQGISPPWLTIAQRELGKKELPGKAHNQDILKYFVDARVPGVSSDETPWCAAFVGACLARAKLANTGSALARSYLLWGVECERKLGAVVVLKRGKDPLFGHVGFLVGWNDKTVTLLGGNQGNAVTLKDFPVTDVLGYRWPADYVPISELPKEEVKQALKENGSRTIDAADKIDSAVKVGTATTALIAVINSFVGAVGAYLPYVIVAVVLGVVAWQVRRIVDARICDAKNGKNNSRIGDVAVDQD